jgi:hypothetical protein
MEASTTANGYTVNVNFNEIWSATILPPGAVHKYHVVVRATADEGKDVLLERLKILLQCHKEEHSGTSAEAV